MSAINDFSLPSNPDDILRIKNAIIEASAQKQMIADRTENIKEMAKDMKETFDMPTKLFNQLVKAHHKQMYDEMTQENSTFEVVYETVLGQKTSSGDDGDDE